MPCTHVKVPGGHAIVCGPALRQRCCVAGCEAEVTRLCDWKVPERQSGTCDSPICAFHSTEPDPREDKDLCPEHAITWRAWKAARKSA